MDCEIIIEPIRPEYAKPLEQLQRDCFPTLSDSELIREEHFLNHCKLFPEGNLVALCNNRVVGLGAGFLIDFDFDDHHHTFMEILAEGWYSNHDPHGDWYYGADISVHPDFRRRGIASRLYAERKAVIQRLNRRGMIGGGLIPGFAQYKHQMSAQDYVEQVVAGKLYDPTLSMQLKNGFEVRGMLENYIEDSAADNWATLLVWENPLYQPER